MSRKAILKKIKTLGRELVRVYRLTGAGKTGEARSRVADVIRFDIQKIYSDLQDLEFAEFRRNKKREALDQRAPAHEPSQ